MSITDRFMEYAAAFEETFEDDDWTRLEQYFTEDATYDGGLGEVAQGRDAVFAFMRNSVNMLDRRMDSRTLTAEPPSVEGDTLSLSWAIKYTIAGQPDLHGSGVEYARFEGDRIAELRDEYTPEAIEAFGAWLAANGTLLDS